jgi:hypothetical protein
VTFVINQHVTGSQTDTSWSALSVTRINLPSSKYHITKYTLFLGFLSHFEIRKLPFPWQATGHEIPDVELIFGMDHSNRSFRPPRAQSLIKSWKVITNFRYAKFILLIKKSTVQLVIMTISSLVNIGSLVNNTKQYWPKQSTETKAKNRSNSYLR